MKNLKHYSVNNKLHWDEQLRQEDASVEKFLLSEAAAD